MNTRCHEAAAVAAILGLGLALAGCANGAASNTAPPPASPPPAPPPIAAVAPSPVAPSAAPTAPPAPAGAAPVATSAEAPEGDEHRHHPHGGIAMLIGMSLADLNLTADQKAAVEKVKAELDARLEPAKAAGKDLAGLLADEVAAGAVDRKKTDAAIDHLTTRVQAQQDASLDALNQLHAILTPPQRAALSDALTAHWDKWKEAQGHDEQADDGKHHAGHLLGLVRDLGISRQQAEQIRTSFRALMKASPQEPEPAKARDHVQALAKTFKNDKFDARTLKTTPSGGASMARWGSLRMARFLEAATPVLVPDQRTRLAEMLRSRAM